MRTIGELEDRGCEAAGYRLSGDVVDHVCCRHLYGEDRMLIAWPARDQAIVVLVERHDRSTADVYLQLLAALTITALGEERERPPCCDRRATRLPTMTSRRTSPRRSSGGRGPVDEPTDFCRNFYRNFYRTGRNRVEASNTVEHADLPNRRSEPLSNIGQHRSKRQK